MIGLRAVMGLLAATFLGLAALTQRSFVSEQTNLVEVVVVVDTTASMGPALASLKQTAREWVSGLRQAYPEARLRLGLIAYRDRGDAYRTHRCALGSPDEFLGCVQRLTAAGGGGGEEGLLAGLQAAAASDWSRQAGRQHVVVIGDAPGHRASGEPIVQLIDAEKKRGRTFDTLQVGQNPRTQAQWREIAVLGGGTYRSLSGSGSTLPASLSSVGRAIFASEI